MTPYLAADRLALLHDGAWAFRGVDLEAGRGQLVAVTGPPASGHTSLLLVLAGRMRPSAGTVMLAGRPASPGTLRRHVGVGAVKSVSDLEDTPVAELLRERAAFEGRWRQRRILVRDLLDRVGLDVSPRALVRDLDRAQRVRLSVASGLVGGPDALVVDDVDRGVPPAQRPALWRLLGGVARDGVAVVAAGVDGVTAAPHADLVVPFGVEVSVALA